MRTIVTPTIRAYCHDLTQAQTGAVMGASQMQTLRIIRAAPQRLHAVGIEALPANARCAA